ncbi:DUF58 domain-containing protein [Nocardioides sp. W3-2-3]|nr:DUF58 domain-containing protein [Nocardioides convexus]
MLDVGPVVAVRADPLGLLRREAHLSRMDRLYVHPRTLRVEGSAAGLVRDLEGRTVPKVSDNDVSFHALRGYVAGDDRRHIHWKSSAKTGTLMVRQFEETRRSHLLTLVRLASGGLRQRRRVRVWRSRSPAPSAPRRSPTASGSARPPRTRRCPPLARSASSTGCPAWPTTGRPSVCSRSPATSATTNSPPV